jgi:hypothetical protein
MKSNDNYARKKLKEVKPGSLDHAFFFHRHELEAFHPLYGVDRTGRVTDEIVGRIVPTGRDGEFLLFEGCRARKMIRLDQVVRRPPERPRMMPAAPHKRYKATAKP